MKPSEEPAKFGTAFIRALPDILEDMAQAGHTIGPTLTRMKSRIDELRDYVDFEVTKAELQVEKMEWESRGDVASVEVHLNRMKNLRVLLDSAYAQSSHGYISDMISQLTAIQKSQS